jgi:ATP-dependent DNA helicase RecQ
LALVKMGSRHPILDGLNDEPFLPRQRKQGTVDVSECGKHYQTLEMSEVDLSFAGRLLDGNVSLQALARLKAGDPVFLRQQGSNWQLTDRDGILVCRLAKKFAPPPNAVFLHGSVCAIMTRVRDDSAEEYQSSLKRDEWSVVLPELVFE